MTKSLVVDASFAFRLVVPGSQQPLCETLMDQWSHKGYDLCAPTLWAYEITSALCKVIRFGGLEKDEGWRALTQAQGMDMRLVPPDSTQMRAAFEWTARLNRAAAYDSFYLALAEALDCDLWTADRRLFNAANKPWVHCVGEM